MKSDGKTLRDFPTTPTLERCKPVLEVLPGWNCDIRGITRYEDLPANCRAYVEFIEKEMGVPLPWSPTVLAGPRSFTGNDAECSGVLFALDSTPDFL